LITAGSIEVLLTNGSRRVKYNKRAFVQFEERMMCGVESSQLSYLIIYHAMAQACKAVWDISRRALWLNELVDLTWITDSIWDMAGVRKWVNFYRMEGVESGSDGRRCPS
jgi:hypothetical protein